MRKKGFKFFLATVLFAGFFLNGCSKKEDKGDDQEDGKYLNVGSASLSFTANPAETQSVSIEANTEWNIAITQTGDWLSADPMSGNADATVIFTAAQNAGQPRSATVNITGAGVESKTLTVTQANAAGENPDPGAGSNYSSLTPEEQKEKMEDESLELLRLGNALKSSSSIEALQNFDRLLSQSSIEFGDKAINKTEDIWEFADLNRVITWNRTTGTWDVSETGNEFKILFPATKTATTNNAAFVATAVNSSGISVTYKYEKLVDFVCEEWEYDKYCVEWDDYGNCTKEENYEWCVDGYYDSDDNWICTEWEDAKWCIDGYDVFEDAEDTYYLPGSVTATLTIGSTKAAEIAFTATYNGTYPVPVKFVYTLTTNDGYSQTAIFEKGAVNKVEMKMSYNGTTMFEGVVQSETGIDGLFDLVYKDGAIDADDVENVDEEDIYDLVDDAFGYIRILDDLAIVYSGDIENLSREEVGFMNDKDDPWLVDYENVVEGGVTYEVYYFTSPDNQNHFQKIGQAEKASADKDAASLNQYIDAELIARKENGFKIAEIVWISEKYDESWGAWQWVASRSRWEIKWGYYDSDWNWTPLNPTESKLYDTYSVNPYLKFADGTLIEVEVYFSSGFNRIDGEWRKFIDAFDR